MSPHPKARKPFTALIPRDPNPNGPYTGSFDYPRCRCIPLDPASVAALQEKIARAIYSTTPLFFTGTKFDGNVAEVYLRKADAVLLALGITKRKRK